MARPMNRFQWCVLVLGAALCQVAAVAEPPVAEDPLATGSLLSDGMVRGLIKRGAQDLSRRLNLDERQQEQLTRALQDRWVPFVQKHRRQMAPLVSRMLEAQLDPDLPSAEEAGDWARNVQPMMDLIAEELQHSNEDVAQVLTPTQRQRFERHTENMNTALRMFNVELDKIADGHLDLSLWAMERRNRDAARQQKRAERERQRELKLTDSLETARSLFLDQWIDHVSRFIRMFQLDESQKQAAFTILEDVRKRADQYVRSRREDIDTVQRSLLDAQPEDREAVLARQAAVVQPLSDLFGELQSRLNRIPTEAQRHQARDRETAGQESPAAQDD